MPRINFSVLALALWSSVAGAKTDPACLQHLGGGFSDAECYAGLSNDLAADNAQLYKRLHTTIPAGNVHGKLLDEYMAARNESLKFCELQRNAGAQWKSKHDGSMFPALYEQCVYDMRNEQNKFLKGLLEMANWK